MRAQILSLFLIAASGCGESNPCKKACARLTYCAGGGAEAGPAAKGTPPAECPFPTSACESPLQSCVAGCVAEAPCSALTGADPAAAMTVATCKAECSTQDLATGPEQTPSSSPDAGLPPPPAGDCTASGCPAGYYCDLLGKKCLPGCAVDAECGPGAKCNLDKHACCAAGESVCGGSCVNPSTNPAHCNGCNKVCPGISGGHAICTFGSCGLACDGGRTLCGADSPACVFTASDSLHCGGCDKPCTQPAGGTVSCVGGSCVAGCSGPGKSVCPSGCADLQSDPANCGSCGVVCPTGGGTAACTGGTCSITCPAGKTLCAGECVDLQTDVKNCGYCGKVCPTGGSSTSPKCSAGKCSLNCYSPAVKCVDTCCDPTRYGGSHCCTSTDSYGKTIGYCLKYGYSCY
jgi:hypothetical protein